MQSQEEPETIRSEGRVRGVVSEGEREKGEEDAGGVEETSLEHVEGIGGEEGVAGGLDRFRGPSGGLRSNLVDVDGGENRYGLSHVH